MVIWRWGACFGAALVEVWSKEASSGSAELLIAFVELLELLKSAPGESGRSKRVFAAMMSAAGLLVRGV